MSKPKPSEKETVEIVCAGLVITVDLEDLPRIMKYEWRLDNSISVIPKIYKSEPEPELLTAFLLGADHGVYCEQIKDYTYNYSKANLRVSPKSFKKQKGPLRYEL